MSSYFIDTERRRSKRYGIKLDAILAFEEPIFFATEKPFSLQCNALDFSAHGLFLEIKKSFMDLSLLLHKKVNVLVSRAREKGEEAVAIEAQVVRFGPGGLGVAFDKMPETVFNDWLKAAAAQGEAESFGRQTQALSPESLERFKDLLKQVLEVQLPLLMDVFFKRVRNDLEQAAANAFHFSEEAVFLDAIRELRFCQTVIFGKFSESVLSETDLLGKADFVFQEQDAEARTAFADKNDFEEWLSRSACIKRVEAHFSDSLGRLEIKLSVAIGVARNDVNNPLDPAHLFRSFNKSIEKIGEIGTIKPTLYRSFETALNHALPELYQAVEALLEEAGGAVSISPEPLRPADEPQELSSSKGPAGRKLPDSRQ